ncbi:MAG: DUF1631 domain-containing protein [Betaproteobacteria bacterium]
MSAQTIDNVISISGANAATSRTRRRTVTPESVGVLNDCRDMALKRIVELLASTFDKIEDELFDLAEKAGDRDAQNMYLDARAQSREKRGAIEVSFKRQFLSFFEKKVSGEDDPGRAPTINYAAMELSLVEDNDLEQKLAINDIAKRMSDTCDDELRTLSQRMGFLLSEPELKDAANPIAPDTIINALKIACDQMTSGYQAKLTVMRMVEHHMAKDMLSLYHDINSHLVARKILPQIRPTYRKAQNGVTRKSPDSVSPPAAAATAAARISQSGMGEAAEGGIANPATDIFATLQQLLAGGAMFDSALSAGSASPPAYGVTTGSFAPAPPGAQPDALASAETSEALGRIASGDSSLGNAGLVSALTHMQQGLFTVLAKRETAASPGGIDRAETPPTELNMIRNIKAQSVVESSSPIDVMTIDIVAMLFDYVFDDKAIPDAIKGLIARLQIPALKVALLDRSFFSKKTHPARRLIDSLAEASVCFAGVANPQDPLYQMIEEVVDRVHVEFETDIQIFADVLDNFEKFMAKRETANADFVEQSARVVHEREKREMARLIALDETERRIASVELPSPVSAIIKGPWARVLERIYLREGGRHAGFAKALETADDLIWSVAPKSNADERKRLVGMLPSLLKNLQAGMEIAAVESEDRGRFFATLVDCHAVAVKAGLRGESVASLMAAAQPNTDTGPLFAKLIAEEKARELAWKSAARSGIARIQFTEGGVEIEELGAHKDAAGAAQESPGASATTAQKPSNDGSCADGALDFDVTDVPMEDLKRGTWVEFLQAGGERIRAKLSWISPLKGVYLFTNPGAAAALSVTPGALHLRFRRGDARVIDESSLIDRAVDSMVNSLSRAAHA